MTQLAWMLFEYRQDTWGQWNWVIQTDRQTDRQTGGQLAQMLTVHIQSTVDVFTASNRSVSSSYVMSSASIWLKAFMRSINSSILPSSSYRITQHTSYRFTQHTSYCITHTANVNQQQLNDHTDRKNEAVHRWHCRLTEKNWATLHKTESDRTRLQWELTQS